MLVGRDGRPTPLEVVKEFRFDAAHFLPKHEGACRNVHGHTYILQVGVKRQINPHTGMVVDFGRLKQQVQAAVVSKLDHVLLNDLDQCGFPAGCPTAEYMVEWIVDELRKAEVLGLSFVRLYETPTSYAEWRAEE